MSTALIYLGASLFILTTLIVLFRIEDAYGDRIMLSGLRAWGDRLFAAGRVQQGKVVESGSVSYVRITWHYFVHTLLKRLLNLVRRLQGKLEHAMQKNKAVARELQGNGNGDTHLSAIAAHKEKVALSEEEKERRMSH